MMRLNGVHASKQEAQQMQERTEHTSQGLGQSCRQCCSGAHAFQATARSTTLLHKEMDAAIS